MKQHDLTDVASWLVRHAAHHAPPQLASRLEEEWLADLSARRGLASRVRFGLGCWWAGRIIAHEHGVARSAAAVAASGHRLSLVHVRFDPSRWSRKTTVVIASVCVQVALIYAFATGLTQRVTTIISPPLHSVVTQKAPAREPPPPLPLPRFHPLRVDDPAPMPTVPVADGPTAIHVVPPPQPSNIPAAPTPRPVVSRVLGGPGAGFPDTDDYYPPVARRLGEAGTTIVQVCVDAGGRLTAAPATIESSGRARIDAGALELARAGSGHYRPTTENGRPVSSCYAFRITFRLRD